MNAFRLAPIDGCAAREHISMIRSEDPRTPIADFFRDRDIEATLAQYGALLFRGYPMETDQQFSDLVTDIAVQELNYRERSTKRTKTVGNVYTSTEYPASKTIDSHSENSFQNVVPGKIMFFAKLPPESGGETPFASNVEIIDLVDHSILNELRSKGIRYVRNFDGGFDLSWQEAYQTEDPAIVESYCLDNDIELEWISADHLRTTQNRPATRRHPVTGVEVWFNQLHLFHLSNLENPIREALVASLGPEMVPRDAQFGDGSVISDDVVDHVRQAIRKAEVLFPWQTGDVVVADNMMVSHGRKPYSGNREIRVALIDPIHAGQEQRDAHAV